MTADLKQGTNLAGKILSSGQVASAATNTTVYTVPTASAVKVASASMTNTGANTAYVYVSVVPSGGTVDGTRIVVNNFPLQANDTLQLSVLIGVMLDAGAFVSFSVSQAASVNYLLTGVVSS